MKIDIIDVDEFVSINDLKEVTSPVIFQRGGIPDPDGLLSTRIFGSTIAERRETFAYIDLGGEFFHPAIYRALYAIFRNIDRIIDGTKFYKIDKDGHLIEDEGGESGIEFLYNNWKKINWGEKEVGSGKIRNERLDLINKTPKNLVFINKYPVLPVFYRDVKSDGAGSGGSTNELNNLYTTLIRHASSVRDKGMFDFTFHASHMQIQRAINDIYEYFKHKIERKNGLIRKYLMGKSVINSARSVITPTVYNAKSPSELLVNYEYSGVPIAQCCGLAYPFLLKGLLDWARDVFYQKNNFFTQYGKVVQLDNPESVLTDKFFEKMVSNFMKNPESRLDVIKLPVVGGGIATLRLTGFVPEKTNKDFDGVRSETRSMTVLDLLYVILSDILKDKYVLCTRYPLLDSFSIFVSKIRILTLDTTEVREISSIEYPFYPKIDLDMPKSEIPIHFIDSMRFCPAYLKGLDADFDGDQVTLKLLWTQEANAEAAKYIKSKLSFINTSGEMMRTNSIAEVIQSFYNMTKENKETRALTKDERDWLLSVKPTDFDKDLLTQMFGNFKDKEKKKDTSVPSLRPYYTFTLPANLSPTKKELPTTVGRYVLSVIVLKNTGCDVVIPYYTDTVESDAYAGFEQKIGKALLNDKIDVDTITKYIDTRDWVGMVLHLLVTTSFSPNTIKIPPEVQKLKVELLNKYSKELEEGDPSVSAEIEKQLITKTKEVLKDDKGLDLYLSGARGSISNNMKNNWLYRGVVKNTVTGKWDVITSSLADGLSKKDIPASSNTILNGAYAKSVQTAVTGYLGKQLLAATQSEVLDVKGSDCGSKRTIPVVITKKKLKNFLYRYIVEGKKLVYLDESNIEKYIGKEVNMRSPMCCVGNKKCNVCCGDLFYKIGVETIGLSTSRISTALTRMSMKKFHDATIKTIKINIDDILQ